MVSNFFWHQGLVFGRQFSHGLESGEWSGDDSSVLHLLCTVFLFCGNPRITWVQSLGWEDALEERKATLLQYSGLENSMDCIVHGVTESDTTERLSLHFHFRGVLP